MINIGALDSLPAVYDIYRTLIIMEKHQRHHVTQNACKGLPRIDV